MLVEGMVFVGDACGIDTSFKIFPTSQGSKHMIDFRFIEYRPIARARGIIFALAIEYLGISGREVSRQLQLSPSAVSKLLQRGRKDKLTEKLSGALFRVDG